MGYRQKYEKAIGFELEKHYEVHHIDHNRKNNKLTNLVALPRDLHNKHYHGKAYPDYIKALDVLKMHGWFSQYDRKYIDRCITEYMNTKERIFVFYNQFNGHMYEG